MAAPSENTLFTIRIVSLDYYMAAPIPGFDICYSSLDGRSVKEVPVIRIFGPTPAGQKACLHIHGVLPFFYIPFPDELLQSSKEGDQYMKALMTALEKALNQNVSTTKRSVHGYSLVRAKKIYGYHPLEDLFIKIYLYHPHDVVRAANILLDGAVLGRNFQPYESHIPYLLHFLVDYNLYGMSHVHSSKIKFRPPLPDSFVGKMANWKKNDLEVITDKIGVGKEAVRESAIWVSSMVSSSLLWPDSVAFQCSIEKLSTMPRRQSICELEGDSVVDDILNEKNKIFTSFSQSKCEVKMVQSLVSIWEEFERYGVQEMTKPLELTQPHPEYVLEKFVQGLQYDNLLSSSLAAMYQSFPENAPSEDGKKLKMHIESQTRTDVSCRFKQCQMRSTILGESMDNHEGNNTSNMPHCLPSDDKEDTLLRVKVSDAHELRTSKKISSNSSSSEEESLSTEAIRLLSWLASSQLEEDLDIDDELVQDSVLSPLFSVKSFKRALEIANLDYEHASQQECQDILDSVEQKLLPDVDKEHVSHTAYHEQMITTSSGNPIVQADGSWDDSFSISRHNNEMSSSTSKLRSSADAGVSLMQTNISLSKNTNMQGQLPFLSSQKEHEFDELYSFPDDSIKSDESSILYRSKGDNKIDHSSTDSDTSSKKLQKKLGSCSVRDLMRWKRSSRAEFTEPERSSIECSFEANNDKSKRFCLEGSPCVEPIMSNVKSSCVGQENSKNSANCMLRHSTSHIDDHVVFDDDIQDMSKYDVRNVRDIFHDAHASSDMMQRKKYNGTGSSTCIPKKRMLTTSELEKNDNDFIEMRYNQNPPSKDQLMDSLVVSTNATRLEDQADAHKELLAIDSCSMIEKLLPFFRRDFEHRKSYQSPSGVEGSEFHEEFAFGVPTHFKNDGSLLYLLSHAISPPSVESVCQWLLELEKRRYSNNTYGNSMAFLPQTLRDHSLKLQSSSKDASKEIGRLHGISKDQPCNISGSDSSGTTPENHVSLLVQQDKCHSSHEKIKNQLVADRAHTVTSGKHEFSSSFVMENISCSSSQDVSQSQISGPDNKLTLTPLSQIGFCDPASIGCGQQLTIMSVEVQAASRGDLRPDPQFDEINMIALVVQEDSCQSLAVSVLIRSDNDEPRRNKYRRADWEICNFIEEKQLLLHFAKIISSVDPDILMGWEIQGGSLGFVVERGGYWGINLINIISRTPDYEFSHRIGDSANPESFNEFSEASITNGLQNGRVHSLANELHVVGRIVLNLWRFMRSEVKLNMYSIEAVAEEVLRRKIPSIPCKVLNHWFSRGPGWLRYQCIEHIIKMTKLNLEIINQLDMINRTSELARVFGIDFFSVLSRGSQFRVESMLLRLAHTQNYLAISPGSQQVALQPAMECLPLVMEPESNFYQDPVVILDFQSLYPSMIIAYNLCYSTCLGKVLPSKTNVLGVSSYSADALFKNLNEQLLAPNGVMYVPSKVRKGVLPQLLEEILSTRIMVKQAIKKLKPSQRVLERIFNARQLALKLIANVTYGYTAAGYSGRMPCAELADSIVQCGRRTLEEAISFVNDHSKWKARVIYGDTDSMFVLLKGRDLEEAFRIGNEIASAVTSMNPYPVTLKLEKVYQPCFLLTKKRYVGYSYESPDQQSPKFDAKGIETVRRDTCQAVAKTLEKSIRLIFEQRDMLIVKSYLQRQWTRILSGRLSLQDFIFAKEVHLGTYSTQRSSLPPAAIVALKAMSTDPRSEPRYGERIPYVVVHGEPGARLIDMVVDPHQLLDLNSPFKLNEQYYIKKQIIPALQRVFGLLGADLNKWFLEMPRPITPLSVVSHLRFSQDSDYNVLGNTSKGQAKSRIDTYYSSKHCSLCGNLVQSSRYLCEKCFGKKSFVATAVVLKTSKLEREIQHLTAICRHCGGGGCMPESTVQCNSLACSVFYERRKVQKELRTNSVIAADTGFYPTCVAEWF
ncbi:DNA polymerase zeta catalytic subunit-like isoform X2 [Zingiber officinale]|uniref:DNA polymerase zeta catalytic subunit-like isoform X2 n=1 Tax=Zingiber officinale TaxID=94328 RepID=UPI001C4C602F|nr:DNA polymerase zeta catalytic subunit-like isoform X2 [Zingiber officinale]